MDSPGEGVRTCGGIDGADAVHGHEAGGAGAVREHLDGRQRGDLRFQHARIRAKAFQPAFYVAQLEPLRRRRGHEAHIREPHCEQHNPQQRLPPNGWVFSELAAHGRRQAESFLRPRHGE